MEEWTVVKFEKYKKNKIKFYDQYKINENYESLLNPDITFKNLKFLDMDSCYEYEIVYPKLKIKINESLDKNYYYNYPSDIFYIVRYEDAFNYKKTHKYFTFNPNIQFYSDGSFKFIKFPKDMILLNLYKYKIKLGFFKIKIPN